ncbi:porin [Caballeronia sp. J97]|uniref:porin n=1 Tax=Caballeronia sp. J97 TaxID=2805429 RepID=UPI002AB29584|nr:porin [Caballeronia sp. J97]
MKAYANIVAATCLVAAGASAHAQSSVTLYGIVDTGLMYVHNSAGHSTQFAMTNGGEQPSRWGLKTSEDLGGGFKVVATLENGFDPNTGKLGQGGLMFGRQAFVGVSKDTWGTVTFGRQYEPLTFIVQPIQGDYYLGGVFTSPGDIDNADSSIRINNGVQWMSPNWAGLQMGAMYSFGGIAGSVGSGQTYSGAASYTFGPATAAVGYLHIDNGNSSLSTRGASSASSLFNSSVNSAYKTARSINIARAGGAYTIGPVVLGGYYSFSEYSPDAASTFTRTEKYHVGSVYAVWNVTPAFQTEIGYTYMKSLGDSSAKQNQIGLAVDYLLSKRTDVYAFGGYAHASGTNGSGPAQAVIGSWDIDSGASTQGLVMVGIRHKF